MSIISHIEDELSELSLAELRVVEKEVKHYITVRQEEYWFSGGT